MLKAEKKETDNTISEKKTSNDEASIGVNDPQSSSNIKSNPRPVEPMSLNCDQNATVKQQKPIGKAIENSKEV